MNLLRAAAAACLRVRNGSMWRGEPATCQTLSRTVRNSEASFIPELQDRLARGGGGSFQLEPATRSGQQILLVPAWFPASSRHQVLVQGGASRDVSIQKRGVCLKFPQGPLKLQEANELFQVVELWASICLRNS